MSHPRFVTLLAVWLVAAAMLAAREGRAQTASPLPVAQPQAMDTGCGERDFIDGYYFPSGRKTFDDERYAAFALRLNTPVYLDSSGDARAARVLRFGERVRIVDPGEGTGRLQVRDNDAQPIGWVTRSTMLCRITPLSDPDKPALQNRVMLRTGMLYQTPEALSAAQRCEGPCSQVSRFQWYFIYAEENDHYLISPDVSLAINSSRLIGWLPKSEGTVWNTALGLRPREELADVPAGSPEKFACAYGSMEELAKGADCHQMLGGKRWFGVDFRIPVTREIPQAYQVLFGTTGVESPDPSVATQALNRLDVFFVVAGTGGMQPAIDSIRGLADRIASHLQTRLGEGGVIRLGFRVYRDSPKQGRLDGVDNSEFLALRNGDCDVGNVAEFKAALAAVKARDSAGNDDFYENSLGGIAQGSADASGCPDNAKLFFVIGGAGYDADKQKSRGLQAWSEKQVADRLRRGPRFSTMPIVFFIQTPGNPAAVADKQHGQAYSAFSTQARNILSAVYAGTAMRTPDQFFIQQNAGTSTDAAANAMLSTIDTFLRPDVVKQVTEQLKAGESLDKILDRLRSNSLKNIPIDYLRFVDESLCRRLQDQCRGAIVDRVTRAFMPADDKVIPEILLSRNQLDKWLKHLKMFTDAGAAGRSEAWRLALAGEANEYIPGTRTLMQANRARSKLLQYSDHELTDPDMPACEVDRIRQYLGKKYDILNVIYSNDGLYEPVFTESRWPDSQCPNVSEKGKNLPLIAGDAMGQPLNPPGQNTHYSMMHRRGNDSFFWVPLDYLP